MYRVCDKNWRSQNPVVREPDGRLKISSVRSKKVHKTVKNRQI